MFLYNGNWYEESMDGVIQAAYACDEILGKEIEAQLVRNGEELEKAVDNYQADLEYYKDMLNKSADNNSAARALIKKYEAKVNMLEKKLEDAEQTILNMEAALEV